MKNRPGTKENPYPFLKEENICGRRVGEVIYCKNASLAAMRMANVRELELRWRDEDL